MVGPNLNLEHNREPNNKELNTIDHLGLDLSMNLNKSEVRKTVPTLTYHTPAADRRKRPPIKVMLKIMVVQ